MFSLFLQVHRLKKRTWKEQSYLLKGLKQKPTDLLENSSPTRTSRPHPSLSAFISPSICLHNYEFQFSWKHLLWLIKIFLSPFERALVMQWWKLYEALRSGQKPFSSLCEHGIFSFSVRPCRPSSISTSTVFTVFLFVPGQTRNWHSKIHPHIFTKF